MGGFSHSEHCEQGKTGALGAPAHVLRAKEVISFFSLGVIEITSKAYTFTNAYV